MENVTNLENVKETPSQDFYRPSDGGFYREDVHEDIPTDAVAITEELKNSLFLGQSDGKIIMPPDAEHLLPWLADQPPPSTEEQYLKERAALDAKYESVPGGLLTVKLLEIQVAMALGIPLELLQQEYSALLAAYSVESDELEAKYE